MLVVHSDQPFSKSLPLKRGLTDFDNQEELKELRENLVEVEAKRNFIINRIGDLAKKFPRTAYDKTCSNNNPKLNEIELVEKVNIRHKIKDNENFLDAKQNRLNIIVKEDRKNKRDMYHLARLTRKIDTIRKQTSDKKDALSKINVEKSKRVDYLHEYGAQVKEDQKESVKKAHSKILEKKLGNFYTQKNDSALNHQLILHQKKQHELERLKKCNFIKYQTNIAKIRMDSVLKDRLESINDRLTKEKKIYKIKSVRQQSKMDKISSNTDIAYNMWSNSSNIKKDALVAYTGLFPEGKSVEIGCISKSTKKLSKSVTRSKLQDSRSKFDINSSMHTFSSMKRNCQQVSKSQFIKQSVAYDLQEFKAKNSRQNSINEQNSENNKEFNEEL